MFKWAVMKAASAIASNTSSLFYVLLYREIFRQLNDLTQDGEQATKEAFLLGYKGAGESAERQRFVFRLFPERPEKIVEYMPLLYQLIFGMPMEEYTQEWNRSDPQRPILRYLLKSNPLIWDIGKDPTNDNLPFPDFWDGKTGYAAIIAGMLTVLSSYVLKIKGSDKAIWVTEANELLRGDPYFELTCQIIPAEELPYSFEEATREEGTESNSSLYAEGHSEPRTGEESTSGGESASSSESKIQDTFNSFLDSISKVITIDKMEEIFGKPTGLMEVILRTVIQNGIHMDPVEFLDHFTNFERDFVRIFGFLTIHIFNEVGQLPEQIFKNDQIARVYGQIFLLVQKNSKRFIPVQIIDDGRKLFEEVLESMAPPEFIQNFRAIPSNEIIDLYFEGSQKALHDLGIKFETLKSDLYEELNSSSSTDINEEIDQTKEDQNRKNFEIAQEAFIMAVSLLSLPTQLITLLMVNNLTGISEILSSVFNVVNEGSQKLGDLLGKPKE